MDINFYSKKHEQIRQNFRHDIIMQKIKQKEDKEFRYMFIKILLIIVIAIVLITLITR